MTLIDCTFFLILGVLAGTVALSLARAIICILNRRDK